MTRDSLVIDIAAAVVIAGVVTTVEPGVAIGLLLALLLLIICLLGFLFDRRRAGPDARPVRRRSSLRRYKP